ncbi:fumarylacetoacetate hydrolase family protein [Thioalkalivibrio sp. HK1]|uniref:fumarylacetoacetate hydrolase family protein n=1 Tax=Thioalkalivibrio sp. HK1 TaxID=1469245 RepID=UPI00046FFE58|nr:fumarylacetoacetate hydrolase family protein [Thioalkalivibrio sp. HK1]
MKLVRYGSPGSEKPGLIDFSGKIRSLEGHVDDIDGQALSPSGLGKLSEIDYKSLPLIPSGTRLGCPVANVGKLLCVGLNYTDHALESGQPIPEEPVLFMKSTTAICGPEDDVIMPKDSVKTDWEVELGIVIGTRASYVDKESALDHVAGYCLVNDVSERAFQLEGTGQWVKGKSADTFAPIGPWVATKDEITNPSDLDLWLEVNNHPYQKGNTRTMIFDIATIVSYISRHTTLMPGDIIPTGTPPGVGLGQKPPVYLKAGDVMRLGVEGLGVQRQRVLAWPGDR